MLIPWFSAACAASVVHRNHFFHFYQQNNSSESKNSDRLVIFAKGFLELPNLHMLPKQKSPSLTRNLFLGTFGKLLIVFSTTVNLLYILYSMTWRCCLLHLIKQNSKNSNLDDSSISLPVFPSRTNRKLHISITPNIVKKVRANLDSWKVSGPDFILVVIPKNYEPELSCILVLFSRLLEGLISGPHI